MQRRCIRLALDWAQSDWLAALEPASRLAWIELLCYVKAYGKNGIVKALTADSASRRWGVTARDVSCMVVSACDGASLAVTSGGFWVVQNWRDYQDDRTTAERSRRYRADRSRLSPSRHVTANHAESRHVTANHGRHSDVTAVTTSVKDVQITDVQITDEVVVVVEASVPPPTHPRETSPPAPASAGTSTTTTTTSTEVGGYQQQMADAAKQFLDDLPEPLNAQQRRRELAILVPILSGQNATAWQDTKGDRVPWPERPKLFNLMLFGKTADPKRSYESCLRYVIAKQTDPYPLPSSKNGNHTTSAPTGPAPEVDLNDPPWQRISETTEAYEARKAKRP